MFDAATLREELNAVQARLQDDPRNPKLIGLYMNYARRLREQEYIENGYVTQRSSVTGY